MPEAQTKVTIDLNDEGELDKAVLDILLELPPGWIILRKDVVARLNVQQYASVSQSLLRLKGRGLAENVVAGWQAKR